MESGSFIRRDNLNYSNNPQKSKIYFLSKEDAFTEYQISNYPSTLQPLEKKVRLGLSYAEDPLISYQQNLMNFTDLEIKVLTWYVQNLCKIMKERANNYYPNTWKLIKVKTGLDWSFPYTINDAIVLPEEKVREMVTAQCQKIPDLVVSGLKTLFHELVHIDQRVRPRLYRKLYKDFWGFNCVEQGDIHFNPFYKKFWVTNPDAVDIQYIMPIIQPGTNGRTDFFLPLLILDPKNPQQQLGILIELNQAYNPLKGRYEYYTTENYRTICSLKEYTRKFYGMDRQLYHPHEIMAHLLADYVVTFKEYSNNTAIMEDTKFYATAKKLLHGHYPVRLQY